MSEELKPCPFCGGKAIYREFRGKTLKVYCVKCKCGVIRTGKSKDNAIMLWNRRTNDETD